MKDFYFVNRVVLPLINSQKRMEAKHDKAMAELDDANKTLEAKNAEVAEKNKDLAIVRGRGELRWGLVGYMVVVVRVIGDGGWLSVARRRQGRGWWG